MSSATRQSATTRGQPLVSRPDRSEFLCRWFCWWVRGYLRKHFHAVRLSHGTRPRLPADVPLIIVLNHPSWWDPLIGTVLAGLFPERSHYVPMDARALGRYRLFAKLGFYGVEQGTARGARSFLRTTLAILAQPGSAVWVTAQGQFADPRVRPPRLQPGIGHLATHLQQGIVLPLALEYAFWNERLPEALARFGQPIRIAPGSGRTVEQWRESIEGGLAATQDALMADAMTRDASVFETLLTGKAGIGGVYDCWRRLQAWRRGERFEAEHGAGVTP